MWSAKPAISVSATATVPSFGSGNGPNKRPRPSGMRPAMLPDLDAGAPRREPATRLHVGETTTDQASPARPTRKACTGTAAFERRAQAHDAPDARRHGVLEHRADQDATQAMADEMHGVAGHVVEKVGERCRVRGQRACDRRIGEVTDLKPVRLEPPPQHRHGGPAHPQAMQGDDRNHARCESFSCCSASRLVHDATRSMAASMGNQR